MAVTPQAGFPVLDFASTTRTSITRAATVNAGVNIGLVVRTYHEDAAAAGAVTGITFNGVALTKIGSVAPTSWSRVEIWALLNPPVGTFNVVATKGVAGGAALDHWGIVIDAYDGVDQTTGWRTAVTASSNGAVAATATVASVVTGDLTIDALSIDGTGHAPVVGANQTSNFATQTFGAGSNESSGSTQTTTDGVMSWTWTTSNPYSFIATALIAAVGGAPAASTPPAIVVPSVAVMQQSGWW